jgi:hypothetical protein
MSFSNVPELFCRLSRCHVHGILELSTLLVVQHHRGQEREQRVLLTLAQRNGHRNEPRHRARVPRHQATVPLRTNLLPKPDRGGDLTETAESQVQYHPVLPSVLRRD